MCLRRLSGDSGRPLSFTVRRPHMVRAILSLVLGLALLYFGIVELSSWHDLAANRVPVVYLSVMAGLLVSLFAAISLIFPRRRRRRALGDATGVDLWGYSAGSADHQSHGHGGDCGHSGGDSGDGGGCGGDGGGGH